MYSGVATGIFAVRNAGKTTNENIGRLPVTVAQTVSVAKGIGESKVETFSLFGKSIENGAKIDKCLNKSVSGVTKFFRYMNKTFSELAKSDKVFKGLSKTVKFASDHVNPLIVVSSGVTIATADKKDRKKTIISEAGCIAGMFAGEGWMKNNLEKVLAKLPVNKKWLPIIKGVTFVAGSITASNIGQGIGKLVAEKVLKSDKNETNNKATQIYSPMNIKA